MVLLLGALSIEDRSEGLIEDRSEGLERSPVKAIQTVGAA
jgi:hypothetical protein